MIHLPSASPHNGQGQGALAAASLLIIDDDRNLLEVLESWFGMFCREVHVANSGAGALALAKHQTFDVVLTDLQMPGLNGLQLLTLLKELQPRVEVIFLTGEGTMEDAIMALREGRAFDFLQKPIRDYHALNQVIERAIARGLLTAPRTPVGQPAELLEALSERERELMRHLAEGLDNRQIAERLVLSEKTVKNHLTRIYGKLQVSNRVQAIRTCQDHGWL